MINAKPIPEFVSTLGFQPQSGVTFLHSLGLGLTGEFLFCRLVASELRLPPCLSFLAFGLLLLRAGKLFERIPESGRYARYLAVASAAFITLVGAGITVRALIETGVFAGLA